MVSEIKIEDVVSKDPENMGGTPVFLGTGVPIKTLFDYLEIWETLEEFLENFPTVSSEKAKAVLELAVNALSNQLLANESSSR